METVLAIALALLAALLLAAASVAQHHVVAGVGDGDGRSVLGRLLRSPVWWAGTFGDTAGFLVQAAALGVGSLLLVQPLLVTTLLFALPLSARWSGRPVRRAEWGWAGVLVLALAAFLVVGEPTEGVDRAPLATWLPTGGVLAAVVVGCLVVAALRPGPARALSLGTVAGLLFGVTAALVMGVVDLLGDGLLAVLTAGQTWATVACVVAGTLVQQWSYAAGDLSASLPAVTVGEPVVAAVVGVAVLGETVRADGAEWLVITAAALAMTVATVALARSSARPDPAPAPHF